MIPAENRIGTQSRLPYICCSTFTHHKTLSFARSSGAIAGVAVGAIAFLVLLTSAGYFLYRRHRTRRSEAEAIAASLSKHPTFGGAAARVRRPVIEDEDGENGILGSPEMSELSASGPVATPQTGFTSLGAGIAAGGLYGSVSHGQGEFSDSDDPPTSSEHVMGWVGSGEGLVADAAALTAHGPGSPPEERDALMNPVYSSHADLAVLASKELTGIRQQPSSIPSLKQSNLAGIEPAEWIGGRSSLYAQADANTLDPFDDSVAVGPLLDAQGSSPGMSEEELGMRASMSSEGHRLYAVDVSGNNSGSGSSHGFHSGPGSSTNGHYSAALSGLALSSSSSHLGHDGRRSPGPSSLLPTQIYTEVPPTAYRPVDANDADAGGSRRRRSFLNRPLKWRLRGGRASDASTAVASMPTIDTSLQDVTVMPSYANASAPHSPRPPSDTVTVYSTVKGVSDGISRLRSGSLPTPRPGSLLRPQSPILENLPAPLISQLPSGMSHEHGLPASVRVALFGPPSMPSPALSENSVATPEGLLHPHLGLFRPGMQSTGQFSFRDEMDYSRPIGGVSLCSFASDVLHVELTSGWYCSL